MRLIRFLSAFVIVFGSLTLTAGDAEASGFGSPGCGACHGDYGCPTGGAAEGSCGVVCGGSSTMYCTFSPLCNGGTGDGGPMLVCYPPEM